MNKFWQTIIFFALVGAMVAFIFSALRPAQYLAESEFLVISNSIESNCTKDLGATLKRVVLSESFQNNVKDIDSSNTLLENFSHNIKVKNYKSSNIINIRIGGASLVDVQEGLGIIQKTILEESHKYYSVEDRIKIKTLLDPRIIRTPRVIMENTAMGLIGGFIVGLIITLLTGLRLDITKRDKKTAIKEVMTKVKEKKLVRDSKNEEDYKEIIKKRLEKELAKEPIKNLNLTDEGYVFKGTVEDFRKSLAESNETKGATIEKKTMERMSTEKKSVEKDVPEVRVISASTMIVSKDEMAVKENKIPENLPVFIEEKLQVDNSNQKISEHLPEIASDEQISDQTAENKRTVLRRGEAKINKPKLSKSTPNKQEKQESKVLPGAKKASAHDIANGFAPDEKDMDGPSNEEIKDRLNKLLRGEL